MNDHIRNLNNSRSCGRSQLGGLARLSLSLLFVLGLASQSFAQAFDISDTTPRQVVLDIESSPDPLVVGTDAGAIFPGDTAHQMIGDWTSDGITGTITVPAANFEALLNAVFILDANGFSVFPVGNWGDIVMTIDVGGAGHGSLTMSGTISDDGGATMLTLFLDFQSDGGPYGPTAVPGTMAGYEEDSIAPGLLAFCTDMFSAFTGGTACGSVTDGGSMTFGRPFGFVPDYPYIPASGLINMPGVSVVFPSSITFSEGGDMRLSEVVATPGPAVFGLWGGLAVGLPLLAVALWTLRVMRRSTGGTVAP